MRVRASGDEANDRFDVAGGVLVGLLGSPACLNEVVDLAWQCALEARLSSGGDCVEVGVRALTTTRVLRHCARTTCVTSAKRVELEQRCKARTRKRKNKLFKTVGVQRGHKRSRPNVTE